MVDGKYNASYRDFLFSYSGNKDREINFILQYLRSNNINLDDYKNIIEGFGGSFALIRYLIRNKSVGKRYTVYDISEDLIFIYKTMVNPETNNKVCDDIKTKMVGMCLEKYKKTIGDGSVSGFLVGEVYYNIHPHLYPNLKKVNIPYDRLTNFKKFSIIDFQCDDFFNKIDLYKDDPTTFIFLDPPYFLSCNEYYITGLVDKFYNLIIRRYEYKCMLLFVINGHVLISTFLKYNNVKYTEFTGRYGRGNPLQHLYFTNKPEPIPPPVE